MDVPVYIKETNSQSQPIFLGNNVNTIEIIDDISIVAYKSLIADNEENLRAAKGIVWAIIFCIPFWLLLLKFFLMWD